MKTTINTPAMSKINWTALIVVLINIAVVAGLIPGEYETHLAALANIAGPALIVVFRTWFTEPKA